MSEFELNPTPSPAPSPASVALTEGLEGLEEALAVVGSTEAADCLSTFMFEFTVSKELDQVSQRRMFMSVETKVNTELYWAGLSTLVNHLHQNIRRCTQPQNVTGCSFVMQWPERGFSSSIHLSFIDFTGEVLHRLLPEQESESEFSSIYLGIDQYSTDGVYEVKLPYSLEITAGPAGFCGVRINFEGFDDGAIPFSMFSAKGLAFSRLADRVRKNAPAELLDNPYPTPLIYSSFLMTQLCRSLQEAQVLTLGLGASGRVLRYVP
jgi:hypothetical protein